MTRIAAVLQDDAYNLMRSENSDLEFPQPAGLGGPREVWIQEWGMPLTFVSLAEGREVVS